MEATVPHDPPHDRPPETDRIALSALLLEVLADDAESSDGGRLMPTLTGILARKARLTRTDSASGAAA